MRLLACTLRDAVCILVTATLSFRALEVAWNNNVDLLPWSSVTFSVALIAAFTAVAHFAFLHRGVGPALVAVACAGVGISLMHSRSPSITGSPINTYVARGWIPSFSIMVQNLAIPEPDDYTAESAQAAEEELATRYDATRGASAECAAAAAQFDSEKPTVIAIMNETFADLSIYKGLNAGYAGPTYYNNLAGALQRGSLAVSVLGGGTCNTEFEFLTGNSLGFIGGNKYPYTLYDFGNVASPPAVQ